MSYKLIKTEPDGNGYKNPVWDVAISNSKDELVKWAKENYGVEPVEPSFIDESKWNGYSPKKEYLIGDNIWTGWLEIRSSDMVVVDGNKKEWKETPPPTSPDGISTEDEQLYLNQRREMGG